ncbi:MAG: hypothetical protein KatS3mg036_0874 [Ignavibacterium sp.]|nr:MAG: hypothetical protein KatS3mg036_0874 [Ignavibacterium sp.]
MKLLKKHSKELISAFNESMMYGTKIKLYLNILEKNHEKLANSIDDYITLATSKFDQKDRTKAKQEIISKTKEIISIAQEILKLEWDRVSKSWFKKKIS